MCVVLHNTTQNNTTQNNTTQNNTTQHTMCEQTGLLCECAGCSIAVLIDDTQWVRGKITAIDASTTYSLSVMVVKINYTENMMMFS